MFGLMGLQVPDATALIAPGASITWLRSCQVRSAARGSPLPSPQIGIDHADQI